MSTSPNDTKSPAAKRVRKEDSGSSTENDPAQDSAPEPNIVGTDNVSFGQPGNIYDLIAKSKFVPIDPKTLQKPYFHFTVSLADHGSDIQPPETFHQTATSAGQAVLDFIHGYYGYGAYTYMFDGVLWFKNKIGGIDNTMDAEGIGQVIEDEIAHQGFFEIDGNYADYRNVVKIVLVKDD